MKTFGNVNLSIKKYAPFILDPTPPSGSAYDQSTLNYTPDTAIAVAGEVGGDPAHEHYPNQGFQNQRDGLTGFGIVAGYLGNVTEPMIIGLATNGQRQASPQDPSGWIAAALVEPGDLDPDTYYYLELTAVADPIILPAETVYIVAATNEPITETNGWAWLGMSSAPYQYPMDVFNGNEWVVISYDGLFWTFTQTQAVPCSSYTNTADCIAAGCHWCDGVCQTEECGTPPCSAYTTQTTCEAASCYWCDGACQSSQCGGSGCESKPNQVLCEAAGCYWYAYPNPLGDPSCHEEEIYMKYLPFILAGVGGLIVIVAMSKR